MQLLYKHEKNFCNNKTDPFRHEHRAQRCVSLCGIRHSDGKACAVLFDIAHAVDTPQGTRRVRLRPSELCGNGCDMFFLIPNKLYFAAYILFFGCYGMIKLGIDSVIRDKLVAFAAKLILCNGLAALVIFGAGKLFSLDIIAQLPNYPLYIIIPAIEIFFIAYELVFTLCVRVFDDRLRNVIITRR